MINLTTGPVAVLPSVQKALSDPSFSHRSVEFMSIYKNLAASISHHLNVRDTYILPGSGTLGNEIMIRQIALRRQRGLVLSNGEFGERLIDQVRRQQIEHNVITVPAGKIFDMTDIASTIASKSIRWLLLCHCESSTGVINQLQQIIDICTKYDCSVYIDCMSTFATIPLDLGKVAMATGSSGKAVGSFAGLALIFCNQKIIRDYHSPLYLDLFHAQIHDGVPFTVSSNLLTALENAVRNNLSATRFELLDHFSAQIHSTLAPLHLIPFSSNKSRIFTITPGNNDAGKLAKNLKDRGISVSWESKYLIRNNWIQAALFSTYDQEQMDYVGNCFHQVFAVNI